MNAAAPRSSPSPVARVLVGLFTLVAVLVALAIALAGAWIGTSLAVFHDGPVWLAIVGAVTCFFLVPLAWELLADRHQVGGRLRDAILRSAFLSLTFVVVLLATHPQAAFKALATRGDWFLGGSRSASAESVRGLLRDAAGGLEWLYVLARKQAFGEAEDPTASASSEVPTPSPSAPVPPRPGVAPSIPERPDPQRPGVAPSNDEPPSSAPKVARRATWSIPGSDLTWPLPDEVHPAVAALPESERGSIQAVGRWLAQQEPDPYLRLKALHDFAATWVAYDVEGLNTGTYDEGNRQSAARVFRDRKGVCAGYANLMVALGKAAGVRVVYVPGDARGASDYDELAVDELPAKGLGHAWNAAKVGDHWVLLDATWDAGHVGDNGFQAAYETTYLFIPPEVMRLTHLPDLPRWQLSEDPFDRGAWLRQPLLRPEAVAWGLSIERPSAPLVRGSEPFELVVRNPGGAWLWLHQGSPGEAKRSACGDPVDAPEAALGCALEPGGRRVVHLSLGEARYGAFRTVGSVFVDMP